MRKISVEVVVLETETPVLVEDSVDGPASLGDVSSNTSREHKIGVALHEYLRAHEIEKTKWRVTDSERTLRSYNSLSVKARLTGVGSVIREFLTLVLDHGEQGYPRLMGEVSELAWC